MRDTTIRLLGLALMLAALSVPLLRAPDRPVETLVQRWAPAPSAFLDLDGQLVHYRDEGPRADAVPIVLLHGTSSSLHTWDGWAKALRSQRRVIRVDLPGFGLTGPDTGTYAGSDAGQPYTGAAYARFVLALLDRLGVQRCVLAGNSLGGEVAWRIAASAPQRVAQLVLVDALAYPVDAANLPWAWRFARLPVLGHLSEDVLPRLVVRQGLEAVYGDPRKVSNALVDRYEELTLRAGNRAALVQRLQAWSPDEGVDHVTGVQAPTLILWGARDRLLPLAMGQRLAADIPGARLVVFDTLGHVPQEEDPASTVAAVQAFLAGMAPARR